jgi:hypothetical protein
MICKINQNIKALIFIRGCQIEDTTVIRPEFKFPAKIEMAFSQMLAIKS